MLKHIDINTKGYPAWAIALFAAIVAFGLSGFPGKATAANKKKLRTQASWDFPEMDKQIEALRIKYDLPGVTVAVVRNERLVYLNCYGTQDPATGQPMRNDNLFRIASISKPVTVAAILKLIDDGRLSMDDQVFGQGGILASFGPAAADSAYHRITIQNLIEHKSGIENAPNDPMFAYSGLDQEGIIRELLAHRPLASKPGEKYYYSNVGYCILGRVIEQITQRPYEEYVREKILASCGIRHMQIGGNKESERLPDEVAYTQPDEEGWPYRIDVRRMDSHGGWVATASDLARFIVHVDRMDRVPDIIPTELLSKTYMGFKRWEHTGSLPGTATLLVRLDDEFSFVLLANRRSFKEGFWHDLSSYPETAIRTRKQWPDKDLFTKVKW